MDQGRMNNQRTINLGLPPTYPRSVNNTESSRPSLVVPSSTIPLARASYQIWNKATCVSNGANSTTNATTNNKNNISHNHDISSPNHQPKTLPSSILAKNDNGKGKSPMCPSPQTNNDTTSHTPADGNNGNDETRTHAQINSGGMDPNEYERKLRRTMLNRMASTKSRLKKYQYKVHLEKEAKNLEAKKFFLQHQVAMQEKEKESLLMENKYLDQRLMDHTNEIMIRNALIQENKNKVTRLRQLQLSQRQELQRLWQMQAVQENEFGGVMNPGFNQSGWSEQMVCPNSMQGESTEELMNRFSQQVAVNPPAVEYGGVADREAYYGPALLNNDPRLQMQTTPNWDQFGTVQLPNPNLDMHNPIPNMSNLSLDEIDRILNLD